MVWLSFWEHSLAGLLLVVGFSMLCMVLGWFFYALYGFGLVFLCFVWLCVVFFLCFVCFCAVSSVAFDELFPFPQMIMLAVGQNQPIRMGTVIWCMFAW